MNLFLIYLKMANVLYDFKMKLFPSRLTDKDRKMVCQHLYGEKGWAINQIVEYYGFLSKSDVLQWVQEKYPEAR